MIHLETERVRLSVTVPEPLGDRVENHVVGIALIDRVIVVDFV